MSLDIPTLLVMGSFAAACSGSILIGAWWLNQRAPALGYLGLAGLFLSGGIFLLLVGQTMQDKLLLDFGNILLALSQGFVWKGARAFDLKPAPLAIVFLGSIVLMLASALPVFQNSIANLGLLINAAYLYAAATTLWLQRKPLLPARWPMIIFTTVHATVMLMGAISMSDGATHLVPRLMSFFGVIHFESILFSFATAMCMIALVKGRSEAASKLIASIDSLTGIANRASFISSAEKILERCRVEGVPVSIIMFDLDFFKSINDTHGHAVGDAVIRKFCEVTNAALRHTDVFGRLGGEEFAVVSPRSSVEPTCVKAERIRVAFFESCRAIKDREVNATVSGGVAASGDGETTLSMLLEQADEALYRAKAAGRNRVKRAGQFQTNGATGVIRVA